jgi:YegS/Rv2252/BmrU family lipid kinase
MPSTADPAPVFVLNAGSGSGKAARLHSRLKDTFSGEKHRLLLFTSAAEVESQLKALLLQEPRSLVVACGGDGTVNLVARTLAGTDATMGIIPLGSGNGLARHLGIPMDMDAALSRLRSGVRQRIDTAKIAGHFFVNVAGLGYDARISQAFKNRKKRGLSGYVNTIAGNLNPTLQPYQLSSGNEEESAEAWMICFSNGSQWGNNVHLHPGASLTDGVLHAIVFKEKRLYKLPAMLLKLLSGEIGNHPGVLRTDAQHFKLHLSEPMALHTDGEPCGEVSGDICVVVDRANLNVLA